MHLLFFFILSLIPTYGNMEGEKEQQLSTMKTLLIQSRIQIGFIIGF